MGKLRNINTEYDKAYRQSYVVSKHNDIVQKSRLELTLAEFKLLSYTISLVPPPDKYSGDQPKEYEFKLTDYFRVCGIDPSSGKNYATVRTALKNIRDKSTYVMLENGEETSIAWYNKVWCSKGKGIGRVRFDEDIFKYVFDLQKDFTEYELGYVLQMTSIYTVRLYEILKSWAGLKSKYYSIDDLRQITNTVNKLKKYGDFKKRVIDVSISYINEYTDLNVIFEEDLGLNNKVVGITFYVKKKRKTPQR